MCMLDSRSIDRTTGEPDRPVRLEHGGHARVITRCERLTVTVSDNDIAEKNTHVKAPRKTQLTPCRNAVRGAVDRARLEAITVSVSN